MTFCPLCGCPVQRTPEGTLYDGAILHVEFVHPAAADEPNPSVVDLALSRWVRTLPGAPAHRQL